MLEPKIICDKGPAPAECALFRQPLYDVSFMAKVEYSTILWLAEEVLHMKALAIS